MHVARDKSNASVAVIGALDTKAEEVSLVAREMRNLGLLPIVIDTGILGSAETTADIDREVVARAGGSSLATLVAERHSGRALAVMSAGANALLSELVVSGKVGAVLAIGGSRGAVLAVAAMRDLPIGFPKMVVTTASRRPLVGGSDIILVPTAADLLGVNRVTAPTLRGAVRMLSGLLGGDTEVASELPTVAISSFGVTTPCVAEMRRLLVERGLDVVVFPANGLGGAAMERMAHQGAVQGIIDVTTHEIADTLIGGACSTTEFRLNRPDLCVPRVVSFGALDFINFAADAVPERYAGRLLYEHSSAVTLMRTSAEECHEIGTTLAGRLRQSSGPLRVLAPRLGFSEYDRQGGPFWDPTADAACIEAVRCGLPQSQKLAEEPYHINQPAFARCLVNAYLALAGH